MPSKKTLVVLSFVILIALIIIVVFFSGTSSNTTKNTYTSKNNVATVYNQGECILEYDNSIYFINEYTNSIIKYDINSEENKVLYKSTNNSLGDRLYIVGNKLIFTDENKTKYIDLLNNEYSANSFINGRVMYINDELYFAIYESNYIQNLNVYSYDINTMRNDNYINSGIASGYRINYLKKIDNKLYFSSMNSDNSSTLFWLDIQENKSGVIAREYSIIDDNAINSFAEIVDVAFDNEDRVCYYRVNYYETSPRTNKDFLVNSAVYNINEGGKYPEIMATGVKSNFIDYNKDILYRSYDEDEEIDKWYGTYIYTYENDDIIYNLYGDVTDFVSYSSGDSSIFLNKIQVFNLDDSYKDYKLNKVMHYNDKYYAFFVKDKSGVCFYFDKDGKNNKKVYEWR